MYELDEPVTKTQRAAMVLEPQTRPGRLTLRLIVGPRGREDFSLRKTTLQVGRSALADVVAVLLFAFLTACSPTGGRLGDDPKGSGSNGDAQAPALPRSTEPNGVFSETGSPPGFDFDELPSLCDTLEALVNDHAKQSDNYIDCGILNSKRSKEEWQAAYECVKRRGVDPRLNTIGDFWARTTSRAADDEDARGAEPAIMGLQLTHNGGCPMKIIIEVPDECNGLAEVIQNVAGFVTKEVRKAKNLSRPIDFRALEDASAEHANAFERALLEGLLRATAVDAEKIVIDGETYAKTIEGVGEYHSLAGTVKVPRWLYRKTSERNGPTFDPIAARIGALEGGWLRSTAEAIARAIQEMPTRPAQALAESMKRLPYSRTSFERVGHLVGARVVAALPDVEDARRPNAWRRARRPGEVGELRRRPCCGADGREQAAPSGTSEERRTQKAGGSGVSHGLLRRGDASRRQWRSAALPAIWPYAE